jgi:predicted nucleic acid-binding protein
MKYFIDTNVIIDFLNKEPKAREKIVELSTQDNSELYINRLVCLESLRTIHLEKSKVFRIAKETLESFEKLEITPDVYLKTINFSRFCHSKGIKLKGKCEAIDFLHFITAKHYHLQIISFDKDMDKLEEPYEKFISESIK